MIAEPVSRMSPAIRSRHPPDTQCLPSTPPESNVTKEKRGSIPAILALMALSLSACNSGASSAQGQTTLPVAAISQFTIADLQAADADAVANNDVIAHTCYPALVQFVNTNASSAPLPPVVGAFSAFQVARNLYRATDSAQIPDYLVIGCAPLAVSAGVDLITLLTKLAGAAAAPNPLGAVGVLFPVFGQALKLAPVVPVLAHPLGPVP